MAAAPKWQAKVEGRLVAGDVSVDLHFTSPAPMTNTWGTGTVLGEKIERWVKWNGGVVRTRAEAASGTSHDLEGEQAENG